MINSIWILRLIFSNYKNDSMFLDLYFFVLITSSYIVVESLAMDLIIMIVIMFFMIFSLVICFPCIIVCQNLMTWRPKTTNDINRSAFEEILNSKVMFLGIFLKKRKFTSKHKNHSTDGKNKDSLKIGDLKKQNSKNPTEKSEDDDPDIFRQNNLVTFIPNDKRANTVENKTPNNEAVCINRENQWSDPKNITENPDINNENEAKESIHPSKTEDLICIICQDEFESGQDVYDLDCGLINDSHKNEKKNLNESSDTYTKHTFHCECLREWLKVKFICPICRTNITDLYSEKVKHAREKLIPDDIDDLYAEDVKALIDRISNEMNDENGPNINENDENPQNFNHFFENSSRIESSESEESKGDSNTFPRNGLNHSNSARNSARNRDDEISIQHNHQRADASSHDDYSHDLLARRNIEREGANNDFDISSMLHSANNNERDLSIHDV